VESKSVNAITDIYSLIGKTIGGFIINKVLTTKESIEVGYSGMMLNITCSTCGHTFYTNKQYFIKTGSARCTSCKANQQTIAPVGMKALKRAPYASELIHIENKKLKRKVVDIKNNQYIFITPAKYSSSVEDLLLAGTLIAYKSVGDTTYRDISGIPVKNSKGFSNLVKFNIASKKDQDEFGSFMEGIIKSKDDLKATIEELNRTHSNGSEFKMTEEKIVPENILDKPISKVKKLKSKIAELELLIKELQNNKPVIDKDIMEQNNYLCRSKLNNILTDIEAELQNKTLKGSRDISFGWYIYNKLTKI
jgi:predicted Zn-ribbon and HTH transcriptional regulator